MSENREELARRSVAWMWEHDTASRALGMRIVEVGPDRAVVEMQVTEAMANGHGICHGGYMFLLADSAFAFACNTTGVVTVAQGADIEFLEPVRVGETLVADARARHRRGRSAIFEVELRRSGELVALFTGRARALGRAIGEEGT